MAKKKKAKTKKTSTKKKKRSSLKGYRSVEGEIVDDSSIEASHPEDLSEEDPDGELSEIENSFEDVDDILEENLSLPVTQEESSKAISSTDPVAKYLMEIRKYPLLDREQEKALAIKYFETKDPKAAERLVTANLRFVVKVASEYSKFGAKMIDLIQEGNVGLMHAVREFNPYKGVRLITYAVWWIRGYIREYLMKQYSMVRIGTTAAQKKLFYRLQKEQEALEQMGFENTVALLSGRLGVSEKDVIDMQKRMNHRDVSLDQPLGENGDGRLMDFQSEIDSLQVDEELGKQEELASLAQQIEELRPELSDRELELLEERLLADDPLTLQEIGERHGVSREAVRQMEVRLMEKLKAKVLSQSPD
ncbi:MAG TPA: RNA polymerase subunit sigma [Bdellovibrionales bacterium]|nr:RNA polymerase subunit sigma [Pseudobdellovibrionaceae bacterium]HAG91279.1 RNA polymerase subunit sigma [Bdellovibrionales bacterium]|tara:strand:+ start:2043 stop:3131 length:1089 start_codon:yes stop_codon:yes gene_type:complete